MDNQDSSAQQLTEEQVKRWEELGVHVCDQRFVYRDKYKWEELDNRQRWGYSVYTPRLVHVMTKGSSR
jgi:hypothetical protein